MKNQGRKENSLFFVIFPPTVLAHVLYITYNTISNFVACLKKKQLALIQKLNVEQTRNYLNGQRFVWDYHLFYYEWKEITKRSSNFIERVNVRYAKITAFSDKCPCWNSFFIQWKINIVFIFIMYFLVTLVYLNN